MSKEQYDKRRNLQYRFFANALLRRRLHEFGSKEGSIYEEWFDALAIQPGDSILDIGTGGGYDLLTFARNYQPSQVIGIEPPIIRPDKTPETEEEFKDRFYHLEMLKQEEGIDNVSVIPGYAHHLSFPDNSFNVVTMIHSIYDIDYPEESLVEAKRVLTDDGKLLVITNCDQNRLRLHQFLQDMGQELHSRAPKPLSSALRYEEAADILPDYFKVVSFDHYQSDMVITEENLPEYLNAIDTYKASFEPTIINDGRWLSVREQVVEKVVRAEMAANNGLFKDTIDIAAFFCQKPTEDIRG